MIIKEIPQVYNFFTLGILKNCSNNILLMYWILGLLKLILDLFLVYS